MLKKRNQQKIVSLLTIGACVGISPSVSASGFQLSEQNASNLGTAYAGVASIAEDASTGFYNPAGLTRLGQEQIAVSGVWIHSHSSLVATSASGNRNSLLTPAGTANNSDSLIPALHYAKRLDESWVLSLNITSPFGLKNNYRNDSIVRYMGTRSQLKTVDIGPSIAYGFNNGLSLGAGVDAMYLTAKLDSRLNFAIPPNVNTDGFVENSASGWGHGYHVGALYEFTDATRVGVHYRSKVKVKAKGNSVRSGVPEVQQGVKSTVTLPETASISAYHDLNDRWALMADLQWTRWKRFDQLVLEFQDGTQQVTPERFKSRVRMAAGVIHQCNEFWKLKLGTAFDKSPVQDAFRTVRIPDQNRIWAAVGAQYRMTKNLALDLGYAHIFFKKANINEAAAQAIGPGAVQGQQRLQGTSKTRADLIGIQLTWDLV